MVQRASRETEGEKILNKRKVREVVNYLVRWKRFTAKHDSWEKEEDLKNAKKKIVAKFKGRLNVKVRRQEKLNMAEEKDFRRKELPEKYTVKMLYR